jgi:uncharacterized protein YaiL (DUF2058 family)
MGGLKDQLLKAGLVNEKQIKQARKEKHKENQQNQGSRKNAAATEEQRQAQQAMVEKAERDRLLNLQRKEEAEKKALAAQIKQLIEAHRQPKGDGETPYNFADGNTVKRLYVSDKVRGQIARGQLAIVKLDKQYELVPSEIADKIHSRDATRVVLHNVPSQAETKDGGEDPYAAYTVPDDLMW